MVFPEKVDAGSEERWFGTTRWTVVLAAKRENSAEAAEALEGLCRAYWYPLYAYIRRRGHDPDEAQDLTQGFFAHLLASKGLASVDRRKGRFRCFLVASVNHFLANEWDRAHAAKRGGAVSVLSLDEGVAETRYALEATTDLTPESLYERQYALTLLDRALQRLESEYAAADKSRQFDSLKGFLSYDESDRPYAEVGAALGLEASAVASAVYRLRQRYRQLLRQEIAQTVSGLADIEDELRWLFATLS
jgi:RNA polymerase sigma-70 factor (ECF subfamily)